MNIIQDKILVFLLLCLMAVSFNINKLSAGESNSIALGEDNAGNLIALWSALENLTNGNYLIRASTRDSLIWSSSIVLSDPSTSSHDPKLAVNSSGNGAAIWQCYDSSGYTALCGIMYKSSEEEFPEEEVPTGEWIFYKMLSDPLRNVNNYEVRINENNEVSVMWNSVLISTGVSAVYVLSGTIDDGWDIVAVPISTL